MIFFFDSTSKLLLLKLNKKKAPIKQLKTCFIAFGVIFLLSELKTENVPETVSLSNPIQIIDFNKKRNVLLIDNIS